MDWSVFELRVAYADPPYIGKAKKHYDSPEVDHAELIQRLVCDYDAWALSANSTTLRYLLPLCPEKVRIGVWVKPFCIFKPNVNPAYAWEAVLFDGARKRERYEDTVRDWVSVSVTIKKGLVGVKPKVFCYWLFELLGMRQDDEFIDLYPGSGMVTQCWQEWRVKLL